MVIDITYAYLFASVQYLHADTNFVPIRLGLHCPISVETHVLVGLCGKMCIRNLMEIKQKFGHTSRHNLGSNAKLIFNDIQALYGDHAIPYRTVVRWTKKFRDCL